MPIRIVRADTPVKKPKFRDLPLLSQARVREGALHTLVAECYNNFHRVCLDQDGCVRNNCSILDSTDYTLIRLGPDGAPPAEKPKMPPFREQPRLTGAIFACDPDVVWVRTDEGVLSEWGRHYDQTSYPNRGCLLDITDYIIVPWTVREVAE